MTRENDGVAIINFLTMYFTNLLLTSGEDRGYVYMETNISTIKFNLNK